MRCVAVIMVRNGIKYVEKCIHHLQANQIEVAIIDQESNDGTFEVCEKYLSNGTILDLRRVPYPGYFSLEFQLKEKYKLIEELSADWIIHQDIDECLTSSLPDESLYNSILKEDNKGYSVINFNELVFIPYGFYKDYQESPYYYFFEPFAPRLMRAWKKSAGLSALSSGGHVLNSNSKEKLKVSPSVFLLKHYIFTSQKHAYSKYHLREFSKKDVNELKWHANRLSIDKERLKFPDKSILKKFDGHSIDLSQPWKKHYWDF